MGTKSIGIKNGRVYSPLGFNIGKEGLLKTNHIPLYGLLYNWYAVSDSRGLAPEGWHVPSMDEWNALNTYLGGDNVAAPKIKAVDNWGIFCSTTNTSGFTAFPVGVRDLNSTNGHPADFIGRNGWSCFRSTRGVFQAIPTIMSIYNNDNIIHLEFYPPNTKGYSVRCVRDSSEGWTSRETVKDYDGNVYHTIQIGDQIWLKENLAVTHYKNGNIIPEVTDATSWEALTTGALCAYDNDWSEVFK
jgi:uncharacterized protein (TIGR02145 family)